MKSTLFLLFIGIVNLGYSQDLEGTWDWSYGNGKHVTELKIEKISNTIYKGNYCSVFHNGSKIDCNNNLDDYCIDLTLVSGNIYEGNLLTNFDNGSGKIRIRLVNSNQLTFEIFEKPEGEYYLPEQGTFIK